MTDVESSAHLSAEGNIEVSFCIESMFRFVCKTLSILFSGAKLLIRFDIRLDVCRVC